MKSYEEFRRYMNKLEWLDFCAKMADDYATMKREMAENARRRAEAVAQAGEGWLEQWEEERKGE